MNHDKSVAARFSASASTYDRYAAVHLEAAERVITLTKTIPRFKNIGEIGCGTGILTEKLHHLYPTVPLYTFDISEGMIKQARKRLNASNNINWIVGNINDLHPTTWCDLLVSSSTLQWMVPLDKTFQSVAQLLVDNGHFVFALMIKGTFAELHRARHVIAPDKQVLSQLPDFQEVSQALTKTGFNICHNERKNIQVYYNSASEFLRTIHLQGVTGGAVSRSDTLLNRRELHDLIEYYNTNYRKKSNQVYATYSLMMVKTQKNEKGKG